MSIKNILILFPIILTLILGLVFFSIGNSVGMMLIGFIFLLHFSYWSYRNKLHKNKNVGVKIFPNATRAYLGTEKDLCNTYNKDLPDNLFNHFSSAEAAKRKIWQPNFKKYLTLYLLQVDTKQFPVITNIEKPSFSTFKDIIGRCSENGVPLELVSPKYKILLIEYSGILLLFFTLLILLTPFYTTWIFTPFDGFLKLSKFGI